MARETRLGEKKCFTGYEYSCAVLVTVPYVGPGNLVEESMPSAELFDDRHITIQYVRTRTEAVSVGPWHGDGRWL